MKSQSTLTRNLIAAVTLAASLGGAYAADTNLIPEADPQAILQVAKGYGSATLQKDGGGDPKIVGRIEGVRYTIDFFGCVKGRQCDDILLRASWGDASVELTDVNQWNSGVKFGRGYLDDDNDPVVEMPINMQGGISQKNLDDSFDYWRIVLKSFRDMLKEKSSGSTSNDES